MKKLFMMTAFAVLVSCNNDDNSTTPQEETIEDVGFFNLKVGNTWTYEYFVRETPNDELSNFISTGTIEEREIIEREVIEEEVIFTVQVTSQFGENDILSEFDEELETYRVKDSLGYLVRIDESINFSSENEEEYLISSQSFGEVFGVLLDDIETVETPAGTFNCIVNETFAILNPDGEISPGRGFSLVAEGVGEILNRISFVSNPIHIVERRLISFDFIE